MGKLIILTVVIISGSILGYLYYAIEKGTAPQTLLPPNLPDPKTISLIDGYKDGVHRVDGTVKLPHSCYTIDTTVKPDANDPKKITIVLTSKDHLLEQPVCAQITTRYPFEALIDAPSDIELHLTLDGEELPITVSKTDWSNPVGNTINPIQ